MLNPIEALQLGFSFTFLFYASYSDIKTLEVSNKVWLFYLSTATILTTLNLLLFKPNLAAITVINIAVTFAISIMLWQLRAIGGADVKCLTCIGIAHLTSLLALGYTGVMVIAATLATHGKRKTNNIPLIPFLTLGLGLITVQTLI